jgi:hypothetical protein
MTKRDYLLQYVISRGIITVYHVYGKDGYNDRYGSFIDSRGGVKTAEATRRHGETDVTRWGIARLQGSWTMAYQTGRRANVSSISAAQTRREVTTLTSVSSTKNATRSCRGRKWHSLADTAFCYFRTMERRRQVAPSCSL